MSLSGHSITFEGSNEWVKVSSFLRKEVKIDPVFKWGKKEAQAN